MNDLFKKWFPSRNTEQEVVVKTPEKSQDIPPANLPLGIDDLFLAGSEVEKLQKDRQKALEKHRTAVKDLESFHVAKVGNDGKRSKTYNQYLGHIEQEIEDIANNLNNKRENFDLPQSREEILKERISRLETLSKIVEEKFAETELGKEYFNYKKEIDNIDAQIKNISLEARYGPDADKMRKDLNDKRIEIEKDIEYKIKRKKEFMNYDRTADRINQLLSNTNTNLHDALDDQYDENGQMRIR